MKVFIVKSSNCTKVPVKAVGLKELYASVKSQINWRAGDNHENVFWAIAQIPEKIELEGEGGPLTVFPMSDEESEMWDDLQPSES